MSQIFQSSARVHTRTWPPAARLVPGTVISPCAFCQRTRRWSSCAKVGSRPLMRLHLPQLCSCPRAW